MTTIEDWKFREKYLMAAANRLQRAADDLHTEAGQLRNRACDCRHEAERLETEATKEADPLRWPIQAEGIGLILAENLDPKPDNIPYLAIKIAEAIQSGNY